MKFLLLHLHGVLGGSTKVKSSAWTQETEPSKLQMLEQGKGQRIKRYGVQMFGYVICGYMKQNMTFRYIKIQPDRK